MKIAQYGTAVVIVHTIIHGLHGLAHVEIPIPLSPFQTAFVGTIIGPIPILSAILLWTRFYRAGSWLLFCSMASAGLFGVYNHYMIISSDHVSQVLSVGWGLLFHITAFLILVVDGIGCGIGLWALRPLSQEENVDLVHGSDLNSTASSK